MSTEHPQHAPVRLLIAEASENTAQELDSLLRDAGIATRMRVVDLPGAEAALSSADLMLCNAGLPQLERILPELKHKAPHVPIILVGPQEPAFSTADGLKLGAADVVHSGDPDELVLVFKRELAHACQTRRVGELNRALKEAEQRCQLLLESATTAIAYVHEGMHIHANPGYLKLFGFSDVDALLGLPLMDLLDEDSADAVKQELKRSRQDGEERTLSFTGHATTGEEVAGTMTLAPAEYEGERCMQVTVQRGPTAAHAADATPATENGGHASPAATANGSSRPVGAAAFLESARDILETVHPHRVVAIAQIDNFGKLQDSEGLRAAEETAERIFEALREKLEGRPWGRLAPHQLAFAITDSARPQVLERVESLRESVESLALEIHGHIVKVTLSIGGAELDQDGTNDATGVLDTALNAAYAAVRRAEAAGGQRIDVLTKEVTREVPDSDAAQVLSRVNDAIDKHRFVLLFQPIISLRGDADEHYEVFLRMVDQEGGHIAPGDFLRTAIDHGMAGKIDRWVILQSIKVLSGHRAKGHNTRLTINLTANSVSDPEFLQWLSVAMKAARLPSDAVIFQITEEDAARQVRPTREFVEGLNAMHCRASLSRFGLTEHPWDVLKQLPVDFVKLDGSHLAHLTDDNEVKQQVTNMIRMLQDNGKLTIVPMVESAGVLSALWQAGANYIQGHYLQGPTTEMDFDFSTDD